MESTLCLVAAIAGAAWIAGDAYIARRRRRETEADIAHLYGLIAGLLDAQPAVRLDGHDAELERHARVIVSLHAAQHADHREIAIDRIRIDRLDRARACWPGPRTEAN